LVAETKAGDGGRIVVYPDTDMPNRFCTPRRAGQQGGSHSLLVVWRPQNLRIPAMIWILPQTCPNWTIYRVPILSDTCIFGWLLLWTKHKSPRTARRSFPW
jgi:hypothetical protein